MSPLPRQGWLFLIEFLEWYFSKYWQVRTRPVFAQTVTFVVISIYSVQLGYKAIDRLIHFTVCAACSYCQCSKTL